MTAHYALIDENNIVVNVILGKEPGEDGVENWEDHYAEISGLTCKRTDRNARFGKVWDEETGTFLVGVTPIRKNFAVKGSIYDPISDSFVHPQPFPSWILNTEVGDWEPPVPKPDGQYRWIEKELAWRSYEEDQAKGFVD